MSEALNAALRQLDPPELFGTFADLLAIPHASGHEAALGTHLMAVAQKLGYAARSDAAGNVIIDIPASSGYADHPRVILQAHQDMVAVKKDGLSHDFTRDPITAVVADGWIHADGTTLGADDGIGIATILALIADPALAHGPLRAIFTVEEETTMRGANTLSAAELDGTYLINLDSEEDGFLYVSCAGSIDANVRFATDRVKTEDCAGLKIELAGLQGGHSGTDIHKGYLNANRLLATLLDELSEELDFFIAGISGGNARNAIPTTAAVTLAVPAAELPRARTLAGQSAAALAELWARAEPNMRFAISDTAAPTSVISYAETLDLIHLILALPNGALRFSDLDPEVVETSTNLSRIRTSEAAVELELFPRSLREGTLERCMEQIQAVTALLDNTTVEFGNRHACWSSPDHNDLITALHESFREITGSPLKITGLHAGLECAVFAGKNPDLQLVSIGSTIENPHSVRERLNIAGTCNLYAALRRVLPRL